MMGIFERFLSLWVALAMVGGVSIGSWQPELFQIVSAFEVAHVNLLIAVLIWLMIYPMMVQVDFTSIKQVGSRPRGLGLTLTVNWLIKPFTMAALAWLFMGFVFSNWIPEGQAREYIAGMILLGVAPCTAMVFVWSQLTRGDANYTLVQVSVNNLIMMVAFAPLAALLLGVSEVTVPWSTLLTSVFLYVVLPLAAGVMTRLFLLGGSAERAHKLTKTLKPLSILGLLATVFLLFALQAESLVSQPLVIVLIAIPLMLQNYGIFFLAYGAAKRLKLEHSVAAPAALIGTSNFFELAVAVAISLFGLHSGAALATVVGVLVEVPVMLSLVAYANRTRSEFEWAK